MARTRSLPTRDAQRRAATDRAFERAARSTGEARRAALQEVVLANLPVATAVARRYRGRGVETDDLEQLAYLGLTAAAERYDVARHRDFLSFAVPWMTGTIRRHFRDQTWAIRPVRRVQELHQRLSTLESRCGRALETREAASLLDVAVDEVLEVAKARALQRMRSLDEPAGGQHRLADLVPAPEAGELRMLETEAVLGSLMTCLTELEGRVLRRWYVDEWTRAEIGAELGLTPGTVSRVHSRALATMRTRLSDAA